MLREISNWKNLILANGVAIEDFQLDQLNLYHSLLREWNSKVNLISRKDEPNIWPNHILHSISPLFQLSIPNGVMAADIGSGGGLPGVPLAIMLPQVQMVMIESIKKKCDALSDIVSRIGLHNTQVVHGRVEKLSVSKDHKKKFDVIFARAVAPLKDLIGWSVPLVRKQSGLMIETRAIPDLSSKPLLTPVLIAMKGGNLEGEIAQARELPHSTALHSFDVRFAGIEQTNLVGKKILIVSL